MDETLSKFVDHTGADPALATDLLRGKNWNFDDALKAFHELSLGSLGTSGKNAPVKTRKTQIGKAQRGLSVVNCEIVDEARSKVLEKDMLSSEGLCESFDEMAKFTFVFPDMSKYPRDFSEFLRRDLIETGTLVSLEQAGHLNWWADIGVCQRLVPLATVGDGNCLLHAASLGMWGFHDRLLTLRKAVLRTLTSDHASSAIKRRWRLQQWQKNIDAGGLVYTEDEWEKEWEEVLRIASTARRQQPSHSSAESVTQEQRMESIAEGGSEVSKETTNATTEVTDLQGDQLGATQSDTKEPLKESATLKHEDVSEKEISSITAQASTDSVSTIEDDSSDGLGAFESLEEIHVFVLAHVLQRPIVVIAEQFLRDFNGDAIAPIPFGGIFLPLECPPENCYKNPLVLTFESAHFSAVVASDEKPNSSKKEKSLMAGVPVVSPNYELMPIHFCVDPGLEFDWTKLNAEEEDEKLSLSMYQKLQLLQKYLDIVEVKIPGTGKREGDNVRSNGNGSESKKGGELNLKQDEGSKGIVKERSWLANQLVKVGNLAGVLGSTVHSTLHVAKLQANKPDYYDKMIENYIKSARERFEDEKKAQAEAKEQGPNIHDRSQPCIAPGCQMFGTASNNYLCSGCFKVQKSLSQTGNYGNNSTMSGTTNGGSNSTVGKTESSFRSYLPPASFSSYVPFDYFSAMRTASTTNNQEETQTMPTNRGSSLSSPPPPSYAEATKFSKDSAMNSAEGSEELYQSMGSKCQMEGCEFYGNAASQGYCSSCFKKKQEELQEPKSVQI